VVNKVIIINQNSGYLTIDVANAYATTYDKVVYMSGYTRKMERDLLPSIVEQKMIRYNRDSTFKRLFTWFWGTIQVFFLLAFKYRGYHVVYYTNPPMAYLSSLFLSNSFSIVVFDTYPDALNAVGIGPNNIIFKLWDSANKKLFKKAKSIITLSNGMGKLLEKYTDSGKIKVVDIWPGSEKFKPIEKKDNPFAIEHNLENKFVVMYSGNMGYTHNVEVLIEMANILRNHTCLKFLLIGEGRKKSQLQELASNYGLENVEFLTWVPGDVLPFSLASADVSIVTLDVNISNLSVPSKTFNLIATGCPILCVAPTNSEISRLIEKYKFGKQFNKEEIKEMVDFILELKDNKEMKTKYSNSALLASKEFVKENAFKYL
jgi:glycosyltransferase involved in cell wall biosynthesis